VTDAPTAGARGSRDGRADAARMDADDESVRPRAGGLRAGHPMSEGDGSGR
jgi:hypothetical protein